MPEDDLSGWSSSGPYSVCGPFSSEYLWSGQERAAQLQLMMELAGRQLEQRQAIAEELAAGRQHRAAERQAIRDQLRAEAQRRAVASTPTLIPQSPPPVTPDRPENAIPADDPDAPCLWARSELLGEGRSHNTDRGDR